MESTSFEERQQLRAATRRFLTEVTPRENGSRDGQGPAWYDRELWHRLTQELGVAGIAIPEDHGGSGLSSVELGIIADELGRALTGTPFLGTAVLAGNAILVLGQRDSRRRLLPNLCDGSRTGTLAHDLLLQDGHFRLPVAATQTARGWVLNGSVPYVVDGDTADILLVPARIARGSGVFLVAEPFDGCTREPLTSMDPTRRLAKVELSSAPAVRIDDDDDVEDGLLVVRDRVLAAIAAEQTGIAERCLDDAVEYAKERQQFGRPIGSFQALKHRCADMLIAAMSARVLSDDASRAVRNGTTPPSSRVAMAAAACTEAAIFVTGENIHIHGGIGFTWEHDAHWYFRRARASAGLFGDETCHHAVMAHAAGY